MIRAEQSISTTTGWAGLSRQQRKARTTPATVARKAYARDRARARYLAALDPEGKMRPADRERCLAAMLAVWAVMQPTRRTG